MLISFIIPAYNASTTIRRCIDSIFSLPIEESDFEVVVIDDCSTDKTVELVKKSQADHSNVVLLCQIKNHRQGAARNRGLDNARGKYIVFLDSDDETAKGVVDAVRLAEENNLDMVALRVSLISSKGGVERDKRLPFQDNKIFSGIELQTEIPYWNAGPCAYVFKNAFIKETGYRFAEDVLYEDSDFVNVHLYHAKRMSYVDVCGSIVHFNALSTTHTFSYKHLCDYALLGVRMLSFYETLSDKESKYAKEILEGGSYNIMKSFNKLSRLRPLSDIISFYNRLDSYCNRRLLLVYREPAYCWTRKTRFFIRHRNLSILMNGVLSIFHTIIKKNYTIIKKKANSYDLSD